MLYFGYNSDGHLEYVGDGKLVSNRLDLRSRWDWHGQPMSVIEAIAAEATGLTGELYIAVDSGESVSPRYDVRVAPKIGDKISYAFNGDYYPDGEITAISDSLRRVVSSTGSVYYRRGKSGSWIKKGGTWAMVNGHIDRRNQEF